MNTLADAMFVMGAAARDAAGRPLRTRFTKTFGIGAADRVPPDPRRWKTAAPRAGTREPLSVEFDEPLDQALAQRLIAVWREGATKAAVAGGVTLGERERSWRFVPDETWKAGAYEIRVATTIEDLAGNNIGKTFEFDPSRFVFSNKTMVGVSLYDPAVLSHALNFLAQHQHSLPLDRLAAAQYRLEDINDAFAAAEDKRDVRASILP